MSVESMIIMSNVLVVVSTLALVAVTALNDDAMVKIVRLLGGGQIKKAITYTCRHCVIEISGRHEQD